MSKLAYNRICYIDIGGGLPYSEYETTKDAFKNMKFERIRGLDVKFDIQHYAASAEGTAKISILGLSYQRISQLASWAGTATAYSKCWIIRVYAGYGTTDDDADMIFEGEILDAMPTSPPDVWLNIEARSHYGKRLGCFTADAVITPNMDTDYTASTKDCLVALCGLCNIDHNLDTGLALDDMPWIFTDRQRVPAFPKPTTLMGVIEKIKTMCEASNITFSTTLQTDGNTKFEFEPKYRPDGWEPDHVLEITAKTGMVGIPTMKYEGIEVTTLLNNREKDMVLGYFRVGSRFAFPGLYKQNAGLVEMADAKDAFSCLYRCIRVRYHGHLRGNEWYASYYGTRFICVSDGATKK